jgi:F-type H+-transporting ATPase subunit b
MDTTVVLLALVIFFMIVGYFNGHKVILGGLDNRANRIRQELAEAKRLREEAESLLASFEKKRALAEEEAATIVAEAKAEAERLRAEQENKLSEFVTRRTKLAEQKIAMAEASAMAEVRAAAADAAIRAAETILRDSAPTTGKDFFDKGLVEVKAKLN